MSKYWYWFERLKGIGRRKKDALLEYYEEPQNIFCVSDNEMRMVLEKGGLKGEIIDAVIASRKNIDSDYERILDTCWKKELLIMTPADLQYPDKLKKIQDYPYTLYVKGKLPDKDKVSISVIGSRDCDEYGCQIAKVLARNLTQQGINVISGMAMGIDTSAHLGALMSGDTYAVLGCGADVCYPQSNISIYTKICANGGIISEYEPGTKPLRYHFPQRNRIISGLSDGILIVQARKESGSLITVRHALEQGKNVYAIPGRVTDSLSEGTNSLIKEGAKCVTKTSDILEDYEYLGDFSKIKNCNDFNNKKELIENLLETTEKIVYASLRLDSKHIEEIIYDTGIELPMVMEALVSLQMKKLVKQTMINYYSLNVN